MSKAEIKFQRIDPLDEDAREWLMAQFGVAKVRYMTREQLVKEFPSRTVRNA